MIRLLNVFLLATLGWFCLAYFFQLVSDAHFDNRYVTVYSAALSLASILFVAVVSSAFITVLRRPRVQLIALFLCVISVFFSLFVLVPFYPLSTARYFNADLIDAIRIYWWNYSHQIYFLTMVTCVSVLLGAINAEAIKNSFIGAIRMATFENAKQLVAYLRTAGT